MDTKEKISSAPARDWYHLVVKRKCNLCGKSVITKKVSEIVDKTAGKGFILQHHCAACGNAQKTFALETDYED